MHSWQRFLSRCNVTDVDDIVLLTFALGLVFGLLFAAVVIVWRR